MDGYAHDARDVARRALRAVVTGDMEQIERLYAADVRLCGRAGQGLPGLAGIRERALTFASSLWDSHLTVGYSVVSGEVVVTRWTVRGKKITRLLDHGGPSHRVSIGGLTVSRIVGGKVVEDWSDFAGPGPADSAVAERSLA